MKSERVETPSRPKRYTIDGCHPILDTNNSVFLSAAAIALLRDMEVLKRSGHVIDVEQKNIYVLMRRRTLAVIGANDGYAYEVARLGDDDLEYLRTNVPTVTQEDAMAATGELFTNSHVEELSTDLDIDQALAVHLMVTAGIFTDVTSMDELRQEMPLPRTQLEVEKETV